MKLSALKKLVVYGFGGPDEVDTILLNLDSIFYIGKAVHGSWVEVHCGHGEILVEAEKLLADINAYTQEREARIP